jgi:hypothetical protein
MEPQDNAEKLWGESLLAVVGVDALFGDGKIRITNAVSDEARRLPRLIRQEIRRFLTATDFDREKAPGPFNYKKVVKAVMTFDPTKDLAARIGRVNNPDDAISFQVAVAPAVKYLQDQAPKRARVTPMGPKAVAPSDQEVSRFRRTYEVCRRVMVVLDDLNEGVLSRDQILAFARLFPSLYEEAKRQLFQAMADVGARRPSFELPHDRDKLLQTFLQTRTMNPSLEAELQAAFEAPEEEQQQAGAGPSAPLRINTDAVQTPSQRIEFK